MTVHALPGVNTVPEAAEKARVSPWMIRQAIKRDELRARHIGRCVRVLDEDLAAWLRTDPG